MRMQGMDKVTFDALCDLKASARPDQADAIMKIEKHMDANWISHPQTIQAKRQWDAVADALGANRDCPDDVLVAALAATGKHQAGEVHRDDVAVDAFAAAMKAKMADARTKGRGGWEDPAQCSAHDLSRLLRDHVEKGDPRDVANFCMMLHQRGEAIDARQPGAQEPVEFDYPEFHQEGMGCGLEDRGITDRYEAMRYGFDEALDQMAVILDSIGPLYAAPPAQGIDLVPVAQDAADHSRQIHVGTLATTGAKIWHSDGKGTLWCGNTYHRTPQQLWDECHSILNDLRQMAESQRDAAPGAGS